MEKDISYKYGWKALDGSNKEAQERQEPKVSGEKDAALVPEISLDDPSLYINQELSWLKFNERVLEEAQDERNPLLERLKFLAICGGNLDEFFMIRIAGLRKQMAKGALKPPADGMTPIEQLKSVRRELLPLLDKYAACWKDRLLPELEKQGISIKKVEQLDEKSRTALREYFEQMIQPTLTPLAMDLTHPFPLISNLSINLGVVVKHGHKGKKYARVKVPTHLFPRLIKVPEGDQQKLDDTLAEKPITYVFLEDLIATNIGLLFHGLEVVATYPLRITRNAEIEISLDQASDLLTVIEDSIESRRAGFPVRMEVDESMPEQLIDMFSANLHLGPDRVYRSGAPLGLADMWQLLEVDMPDLKDPPFLPYTPQELSDKKKIFSAVSQKDYVLYHPYDSFAVIVNMLKQAAVDPDVLVIKITLYRIDKKSPIIDALMEARHNGKSVVALVEQNNIIWAKALENAGVHVIYGLEDLKVHSKMCLIVRKEKDRIVQYAHISSGNYNAVTGRIYGDIGYITANKGICSDVASLLNALTGYSEKDDYRHLLVAPKRLRSDITRRIEREIEKHAEKGGGRIAIKINGLVDKEIIKALYRASIAGVKVDLNVRGLCCLRPGIAGVSENIRVHSIVGRFLEHARIYYFRNGGEEEVLLGSSDMMPRNLNRRIETLLPVPDRRIKQAVIKHMLEMHLADTVKARRLLPDGTYERVKPKEGVMPFNSQEWLIDNRGIWHESK